MRGAHAALKPGSAVAVRRAAGLAAVMLLAGCEVGPAYRSPTIALPHTYGELPASSDSAPLSVPSASRADLERWWLGFHDAELERLIERCLHANLELAAAASRIRQARAEVIAAGAPLWPSVSALGSAVRLDSNSNPLASVAPPSGSSGIAATLYSLGFDASWEADLFGGTRRGVEAARAGAESARWQMRDLEVSLTAEVANDYLALRATQARVAILSTAVRRAVELLALAQARFHAGLVTELDVNQERAQLAATRAEIPTLEADERTRMHALAVLLAEPPLALVRELGPPATIPAPPPSLPIGLPSDLLRRRPDVRAAERRLAAATANVGVAVAAQYPRFDLLGLAATAGGSGGGLFSAQSLAGIALATVTWPVFQGGKREADVRASKEQRLQAYLAYRQTVLAALGEVEDALVGYEAEQRRLLALRRAVAAARSSLQIARAQYRAGTVTFIDVLEANQTYLESEDQVQQSAQALMRDLVALYKALGGGWADTRRP